MIILCFYLITGFLTHFLSLPDFVEQSEWIAQRLLTKFWFWRTIVSIYFWFRYIETEIESFLDPKNPCVHIFHIFIWRINLNRKKQYFEKYSALILPTDQILNFGFLDIFVFGFWLKFQCIKSSWVPVVPVGNQLLILKCKVNNVTIFSHTILANTQTRWQQGTSQSKYFHKFIDCASACDYNSNTSPIEYLNHIDFRI